MQYVIATTRIFFNLVATATQFGTQTPYEGVAHDARSYLVRTPRYKIVKKFLHKYLTLLTKRQFPLLRGHIASSQKVLMLYTGKDSFGDANLELSGRSLLRGHDVAIDLLTIPKLKPQFEEDDVFGQVFSDISQLDVKAYDLILLAEFNHRSLRLKTRHFKTTPMACLFGYFDGPARNQSHYSYAAFNDLYDLGLSAQDIAQRAKPYLHSQDSTARSVAHLLPTRAFLALSIGGVDSYRSYQHWGTLLQNLDSDHANIGLRDIVLIGSGNGISDAQALEQLALQNLTLVSLVGKLSLLQTRAVIAQARLFVGCDGGLMHVAHSTNCPTVTLFSNKEPYQYWTTPACDTYPIQSSAGASLIAPQRVLDTVLKALDPHSTSTT